MTLLLFGLDGASLENIGLVMQRVDLPNFRRVLKEGHSSDLLSVYPYVTAPAWTSIFSGVNPGKHGIFEMFHIGEDNFRSSNMRDSDVPFIWDYFSWAGKRVLVMGVPFIYPPPEINGVFIGGRFTPKLSTFPSNIKDRYNLEGYGYTDLPTSDESVNEVVFQRGARSMAVRMIADLIKRMEASLAIIDSGPWDAVILVDSLPDELFHISYDDPQLIDAMFIRLDAWLGEILKRMKPTDQLLVISDHGFSAVKRVFFLNEWLQKRGYLVKPRSRISEILGLLGINWDSLGNDTLATRIYRLALTRFPRVNKAMKRRFRKGVLLDRLHPEAGSSCVALNINESVAWIRILDSKWAGTSTRDSILKELNTLKKQGMLRNVFRVEEIYHGKYLHKAPGSILVEAREGWQLDTIRWNRGKLSGTPMLTRKGIHRREGLVIFYGPDQPNIDSTPTLYDVVPTILSMMKLPIPDYLDGRKIASDGRNSQGSLILQVPEGL